MTVGSPDRADDVVAIAQVVARLAFLADHGDIDEYLALMDRDVEWHMPANPALGLAAEDRFGVDAVREGVEARRKAGVQGPGSATKHLIANTTVQLTPLTGTEEDDEGADHGRADSFWHFYRATTGTPVLVAMGRYEDRFRRLEKRWLLQSRYIIRD